MNSYDVAKWLNSECTDEEFAEVFAYLDLMCKGRTVKGEDLTKDTMINTDIDMVTRHIANCLYEIIPYNSEMDKEAWWK